MHTLRSLFVLALTASVSFAQAPKDEPQIAITARILTLHESDRSNLKFAKLWLSNNMNGRGKPEEPTLHEVLKGLEEFKTVTVTTLPKAVVFSGQNAEVMSGKTETVITGFDKAGEPIRSSVHNGSQLKLKATLDKDGEVRINVDAKHTVVNHHVPLTPVTMIVNSVEGNSPIPFTNFHAKPDVEKAGHGGISSYRNGGSQMWDMGMVNIRTERTMQPPVIGRIPYLGRLTASKKWTTEKSAVFLILTAELVEQAPVVVK